MRFNCNRRPMLDALKILNQARGCGRVNKVMTGILLNAESSPSGGRLTATATDGNEYCQMGIAECDVQEPGQTVLLAPDKLAKVLAEPHVDTIDVQLDKYREKASVHCYAGKFGFDVRDYAEFPTLSIAEGPDCSVRLDDLSDGLNSCLGAAGYTDTKPGDGLNNIATNAVTFEHGSDGLKLIATNFSRGATTQINSTPSLPKSRDVSPFAVGTDSVQIMASVIQSAIAKGWTHGDFVFSDGRVQFTGGNATLIARHFGLMPVRLKGKPQPFDSATVSREFLLRAARSLEWVHDKHESVFVTARPGHVLLSATSQNGRGEVCVPINGRSEIDRAVVKCTDLVKVLSAAKSETVEIGLAGSSIGIDTGRTFYTLALIGGSE